MNRRMKPVRMFAADATTEGAETPPDGEQKQEPTFTQAELDRIVRERVKREREKFADYDDLKAKAGDKATAEERIAALENEIQATRLAAARAQIVNEFGLTEKQAAALKYAPSEEAAREIAEGLAAESSERKQSGNHVPREGNNPNPQATGDPMRDFTRNLFARANSE